MGGNGGKMKSLFECHGNDFIVFFLTFFFRTTPGNNNNNNKSFNLKLQWERP